MLIFFLSFFLSFNNVFKNTFLRVVFLGIVFHFEADVIMGKKASFATNKHEEFGRSAVYKDRLRWWFSSKKSMFGMDAAARIFQTLPSSNCLHDNMTIY